MNLEYLKYSSQMALLNKKCWRGAPFLFLFFPMQGHLPRTQDTPAGSRRLDDAKEARTRTAFVLSRCMSDSLGSYGLYPARPLCPRDSPGKSTGVGCHVLLQGIFLTQGSNPRLCLRHWQAGSLPLVPPGKELEAGSLQRWPMAPDQGVDGEESDCVRWSGQRAACLCSLVD